MKLSHLNGNIHSIRSLHLLPFIGVKPIRRELWRVSSGYSNPGVSLSTSLAGMGMRRSSPRGYESPLSDRIGVRGAIHQALLKRGIDPIPRDPWYYPTARQYEIVSS
jgi:hypothetical protein